MHMMMAQTRTQLSSFNAHDDGTDKNSRPVSMHMMMAQTRTQLFSFNAHDSGTDKKAAV
jgi:hypothetical protein